MRYLEGFNFFNPKKPNQKLIDDILGIQGKPGDQRVEKTIYTEDQLSKMEYKEIKHIWDKTFHPKNRPW